MSAERGTELSRENVIARAQAWVERREADPQTVGVGINEIGADIIRDLLALLPQAQEPVGRTEVHGLSVPNGIFADGARLIRGASPVASAPEGPDDEKAEVYHQGWRAGHAQGLSDAKRASAPEEEREARDLAFAAAEARGINAGVLAAMEMLRDISGRGTDVQAYDHVIRRLQDHYGGWDNQIHVGFLRASESLRAPTKEQDATGGERHDG